LVIAGGWAVTTEESPGAKLHHLARPPENMSDAAFWIPESKT
jgi:hypothetical protein